MDWIVILFGASFLLSVASACAHELSKEGGTLDGVILCCCQIFPYYAGPLLFTGNRKICLASTRKDCARTVRGAIWFKMGPRRQLLHLVEYKIIIIIKI